MALYLGELKAKKEVLVSILAEVYINLNTHVNIMNARDHIFSKATEAEKLVKSVASETSRRTR